MEFTLNRIRGLANFSNKLTNVDKLISEFKFRKIPFNEKSIPMNNKEEWLMKIIIKVIIEDRTYLREIIQILLHTGNDAVALIIEPKWIDLCDLSKCDPKNGHVEKFSFGDFNNKNSLIQHKTTSSSITNVYSMINSPRGFCLLINNYFTIGTYKEMQRFRNIFHQLHFDVSMEKNLCANEIMKKLIGFSKSADLFSHNAFVFMLITKKSARNEILSFNDEAIDIQSLIGLMDCKQLKHKPKLFFFNSCRQVLDKQIDSEREVEIEDEIKIVEDIYACHSTLDGDLTNINWNFGTYFGRALADTLVEKAWSRDIVYIMNKVRRTLNVPSKNEDKVIPFVECNKLSETLCFFPYLPEIVRF